MSLNKYFDDLEEYENSLYCSECGGDKKDGFHYSRTCSSGEVYYCQLCKTEKQVSNRPNEDNY